MNFDEWFEYEYPAETWSLSWMPRLTMRDIMETAWLASRENMTVEDI